MMQQEHLKMDVFSDPKQKDLIHFNQSESFILLY